MNTVEDDDQKHCSIITLVKKGYDVFKRFLIGKPIQSSNNNANSEAPESDIPATLDGNLLHTSSSRIIYSRNLCLSPL